MIATSYAEVTSNIALFSLGQSTPISTIIGVVIGLVIVIFINYKDF
jgi:hypothetical protein